MNNEKAELFMKDLVEAYQIIHNRHMRVIKQYKDGLITHRVYHELDVKLSAELKILERVSSKFLNVKNS